MGILEDNRSTLRRPAKGTSILEYSRATRRIRRVRLGIRRALGSQGLSRKDMSLGHKGRQFL
jgi:hypothetical protein